MSGNSGLPALFVKTCRPFECSIFTVYLSHQPAGDLNAGLASNLRLLAGLGDQIAR